MLRRVKRCRRASSHVLVRDQVHLINANFVASYATRFLRLEEQVEAQKKRHELRLLVETSIVDAELNLDVP